MKTIKKIIVTIGLLLGYFTYAQQDVQVTQYMYNMNVLNPAYAGSNNAISIGLLGRTQWVGIDGAPRTLTAAIHSPIAKRVGLGFSVIADEIGPVKEQNAYADFSYTLPVSDNGNLAFGLKTGFTFLQGDLTKERLATSEVDPAFLENLNKTLFNFGAGIYYYTNRFYLGLSMPNVLETLHFKKRGNIIEEASEKMHYFATTGFVLDLTESVKFKPSLLVKATEGAPLSYDVSANFLFNEMLELGASYRKEDSLSGMLNVRVTPALRIGYAYDYILSDIGNYTSGSHEVFLLYTIDGTSGNEIVSPRFF